MQEAIMEAVAILLPAVATVLGVLIMQLVVRAVGTEKIKKVAAELDAKQELAMLAVRFVEQFYVELSGPQKYDKAAHWMATQMKAKGFEVDYDEIQGMIESAVRSMKDAFGEEWAEQIREGE